MNTQNKSIDDFRAKKNFEGDNVYWKASDKKISYVFRKIKKLLSNVNTACDIGIGNGFTLKFFYNKGVTSTGIDISSYLINHFKDVFTTEKMNIKLIETDITKSAFGEKIYDIVTAFDVLEHLPDEGLNEAIKNIATSLKTDGIFVGNVPVGENLEEVKVICPQCGHHFHPNGHHQSFQSVDDIKKMLNSYFEVIKFGEVPIVFTRIFLFYAIGNYFFRLARRFILNKRLSSVYFVAKLKDS